jgi:glycosyltransferase involved in cell wall biosynthesis
LRTESERNKEEIFLLCHFVPYPPSSGIELRVYRLLKWMKSAGYRVVLIVSAEFTNEEALEGLRAITYATHWTKAAHEKKVALRTQLGMRFPRARKLIWETVKGALRSSGASDQPVAAASSSEPPIDDRKLAWFMSDDLMTLVRKLARQYQPRAVIVEYVFATPYFACFTPDTLKIVDTIDVFSLKEKQVEAYGITDFLRTSRDEERGYLLTADLIVAIQSREAALLQAIAPEREVILAGVDFDVSRELSRDTATLNRLVVVGSDNPLNVHGLQLFLADCWPTIKRSCSTVTLHIVGKVGDRCKIDDASIHYDGWVADLDAVYREASVVINPTIAGTGLKIKSVEALAHGKPLVAWTHGVDGLSYDGEPPFIECTSWDEFALAVTRLLRSSEERLALSKRALAYAHAQFDATSVYAALSERLDAALAT